MSVRVRPLESRDKPVWLVLFKGYIEFYQATVPEDVIETLWQRLMRGLVVRLQGSEAAGAQALLWRSRCVLTRG